MYSLAVLDDRPEQRVTLLRTIDTLLPGGWKGIECPLLQDRSGYHDWLLINDAHVLLVDQVLDEQTPNGMQAVDYKGHEVIESIRKTLPNFPIYIFTAQEDEELPGHEGEAEYVIKREDFRRNSQTWVDRMVRAGQGFHENHERQLAEMTALATKVATGSASDDEKVALGKLQVSMGTPKAASIDLTREQLLGDAEDEMAKLEELRSEIETLLQTKEK